MNRIALIASAVLCACGSSVYSAPVADHAAPVPMHIVSAPVSDTPVRVAFQNVEWGTPGCFFFSGPGALGRDTQLGSNATLRLSGPNVSLSFDPVVVFHGHVAQGSVSLTRERGYDYEGKWRVTEVIRGQLVGASLRGTYQYSECNLENATECPSECTIVAQLIASP